jgi:hypothetical protein
MPALSHAASGEVFRSFLMTCLHGEEPDIMLEKMVLDRRVPRRPEPV